MKVKSEERAVYAVDPKVEAGMIAEAEDYLITRALNILVKRLKVKGACMSSPADVKNYLTCTMSMLEHEVFACLFLDSQNVLIAYEELFRGTLTQTSVYPREIIKAALACNAAAVIFAHNHPSGVPEPSSADISLTGTLKTALAMVDVRVLDHIIVAGSNTLSFAERGLI